MIAPDALPVLYSFRRCPYAMRARLALSVAGVRCELREVVLKEKPPEMLAASPKATVPVLVLPDGQVLDESLAIMDYALSRHDPEQWRPTQNEVQKEAQSRVLIERNDGPFKQALDRYKYSTRFADADPLQERAKAAQILADLDRRLQTTAYLVDEQRRYADVACAPFVRQFAFADKAWFDEQPWPALQRWLEDFLGWERFAEVMRKHAPWRAGAASVQAFGGTRAA